MFFSIFKFADVRFVDLRPDGRSAIVTFKEATTRATALKSKLRWAKCDLEIVPAPPPSEPTALAGGGRQPAISKATRCSVRSISQVPICRNQVTGHGLVGSLSPIGQFSTVVFSSK